MRDRLTEHEIDEILGLGSYLGGPPPNSDFRPQDLFSWSAPGTRNHTALGTRYFSIDNGTTNIVGFNQDSTGDFGDWLSGSCPQSTPYVQNAFSCKGQVSDVTATSPEGVNLDVIGYDLTSAIPPPGPTILGNISTRTLVETGDKVLIGGFIVTGTQPKKVICTGHRTVAASYRVCCRILSSSYMTPQAQSSSRMITGVLIRSRRSSRPASHPAMTTSQQLL